MPNKSFLSRSNKRNFVIKPRNDRMVQNRPLDSMLSSSDSVNAFSSLSNIPLDPTCITVFCSANKPTPWEYLVAPSKPALSSKYYSLARDSCWYDSLRFVPDPTIVVTIFLPTVNSLRGRVRVLLNSQTFWWRHFHPVVGVHVFDGGGAGDGVVDLTPEVKR